MRKLIIDTDVGSDDAVALLMALREPEADILAITAAAGNCSLEHVVANALMTLEVAGPRRPPVYRGARAPIYREKMDAVNVHGEDGMSDCGLIHPTLRETPGWAPGEILRLVRENPGEVEIIALGPVTNLALAIMQDRETMSQVRHIWSMATGGFGLGNVTPYAEFNVYADPEAFDVLLKSGIPLTIAGFDLCAQEGCPLTTGEMEHLLRSGREAAVYAVRSNQKLMEFKHRWAGRYEVDLADAVAMAAALWEDTVLEAPLCYCQVCTCRDAFYGQVAVYSKERTEFLTETDRLPPNARVIRRMDMGLYKARLLACLTEA